MMEMINDLSEKLDKRLRIIRYAAPGLASVGIVIILRKTYAFSMFKNVHEIPPALISHNKSLRGYVEGVINGQILSVQHLPIFFRNLEKRKQFLGQDALPFHVNIAGIEPRSGCKEHLQKEVNYQPIKLVPLGINSKDELEAVIYLNKGFFSRSVCLNENLVQNGLAVVQSLEGLQKSKASSKLSITLLQAEVYAQRKCLGIWKKPSYMDRLKTWVKSLRDRLPFIGKTGQ